MKSVQGHQSRRNQNECLQRNKDSWENFWLPFRPWINWLNTNEQNSVWKKITGDSPPHQSWAISFAGSRETQLDAFLDISGKCLYAQETSTQKTLHTNKQKTWMLNSLDISTQALTFVQEKIKPSSIRVNSWNTVAAGVQTCSTTTYLLKY